MTSRLDQAAERSSPDASGPGVVAWYAEGFRDALGDRLLLFDSTGPGLELLRVRGELAAADGFEAMLRARVEALRDFRHPAFAPVRAVKWLDEPQRRLAVVSDHVDGERLSRVLRLARARGLRPGPDAVVWLLRTLLPGLAALHEYQGIAHGLLTADRIVVGGDGRLSIAGYVFALALERQRLTPFELWERFGVAIAPGRAGAGLSRRADVEQVARLAIAMLSDRVDVTTPGPLPPGELLGQVRTHLANGPDRRLADWLARALGVDEPAFETAREAAYALDGMLARREGTWTPWLLPAADLDAAARAARPALPAPAPEAEEDEDQDERMDATIVMSRAEIDAMSAAARAAIAATPVAAVVPAPRAVWQQALPYVAVACALLALAEGALLVRTWRAAPAPAVRTVATSRPPAAATPALVTPARPGAAAAPAPAPITPPPVARGASHVAVAARVAGSPVRTTGSTAASEADALTSPPAPGIIGWVAVRAPVSVRVYANGRLLGSGALVTYRLPEGSHEIRLVNEYAGIDDRSVVRVAPGQTVNVSPKPAE